MMRAAHPQLRGRELGSSYDELLIAGLDHQRPDILDTVCLGVR